MKHKQKGIVWVYVAVGIFLFGAGSAIVLAYNHAINARNKAEEELRIERDLNESMREEVADLQLEKEALDKQLVVRKAVSDALIQRNNDEITRITTVKETSEAVRIWSSSPIPIELINSLRGITESKGTDTKGTGSSGLVNTGKDTKLERHTAQEQ